MLLASEEADELTLLTELLIDDELMETGRLLLIELLINEELMELIIEELIELLLEEDITVLSQRVTVSAFKHWSTPGPPSTLSLPPSASIISAPLPPWTKSGPAPLMT